MVSYLLLSFNQIVVHLPANILHRLECDLSAISTKFVSRIIPRVEQVVQGNDQWLQMSGNMWQLREFG